MIMDRFVEIGIMTYHYYYHHNHHPQEEQKGTYLGHRRKKEVYPFCTIEGVNLFEIKAVKIHVPHGS